jgi:hypothetical protein
MNETVNMNKEEYDRWVYRQSYAWASDWFQHDIDDYETDPKRYYESMGWDPDEWMKKVNPDDVDFTGDDVTKLASIVEKYFKKYANEDNLYDIAMSIQDENEVADFITNTIAKAINNASQS